MKKSLITALILVGAIFALSSESEARSPYLVSPDGTYLGNLSANKFDPNSTSNPFGVYGSKFSSKSVNNPFGAYGSKFSNKSANNPYATSAPRVYGR
jgi:hypothetical protein